MPAIDLAARALEVAIAEVGAQCLGQEFGVAVFAVREMLQQPPPHGVIPVPGWWLELTARNPLLGESPLFHLRPVGLIEPVEAMIKAEVSEGLRQLRELAAQKLNGSAKRT